MFLPSEVSIKYSQDVVSGELSFGRALEFYLSTLGVLDLKIRLPQVFIYAPKS